jgi:hypothetical protein
MLLEQAQVGLKVRRRNSGGGIRDRRDLGPRRVGVIVGEPVVTPGSTKIPVQWLPRSALSRHELVAVQRLEPAPDEHTPEDAPALHVP